MGDHGSGRPRPSLDSICAERVRRSYLNQLRHGDDLRVDLLHEIARDIADRCGHSPLKAHRIAWGWTVAEAVAAFHSMCREDGIKPRGLVARSWMEWEAGARPNWDYQDLLSRLFHTNPVQLGWAADYAPAERLKRAVAGGAAERSIGAVSIAQRSLASQSARAGALLHLPPDTEDFTGRADHVDQVARLITAAVNGSDTAVSIAAISGKAGVGKTTLAIHVAHQVGTAFPDGQIYTNLRGAESRAADPADVLAGFLRELGVDGVDIPEGMDERARMYRAQLAQRRILVVLDNAADEAQVRPLLPGTPSCAVLVTSRGRMTALVGAHGIALDVMPSAQAIDLLAAIVGAERTAAESTAVEVIVRLCGYLPLAIRIAGARLLSRPAWTIAWFAARLSDESRRLDLLKAGDLEVRASFALSYRSRDESEQRAFRMLGLINSDFASWNLAVLLETDPYSAEQTLEQLVDAELVEIVGVDATGLLRYRLHDLLRDFARECLNESEPAEVRGEALTRLVREYAGAASLASALLHPGDSRVATPPLLAEELVRSDPWRWFTAERANLVGLVDQAHAAHLWDLTCQLAASLPDMFDWRADWRSWEHTHRLALEAAQGAHDEHAEGVVLRSLGALYRELGRYDDAVDMLTRAAGIFDRLGDEHRWAAATRNLGDTYRYQGRLEEAIAACSAAFELFSKSSDTQSAAGALNGIADASRGLSRWAAANRHFTACIRAYHDLDDRLEEARAKVRYALVFRDQCMAEQASALVNEALPVFREFGDRRWEARSLRQLAILHRNNQDNDTALPLFERCMAIFEELADRRGIAVTMRNRGDGYRLAGQLEHALIDLEAAAVTFEEIGDQRWLARARLSIAGLHRRRNDWLPAARNLEAALATFKEIRDQPAEARVLQEFGISLRDQDEFSPASQALAESLAIFRSLGDALWSARLLASQARLAARRDDDPAPLMREATEICRNSGVISPQRIEIVLREW
jgi:tetratricopeptide (TPR) repeat protein